MRLQNYFQSINLAADALRCYALFAKKANWPLVMRLRMYTNAYVTFTESVSEEERKRYFQLVYEDLVRWQVFRGRGKHLTCGEIYTILIQQCVACALSSSQTLMTVKPNTQASKDIHECLKRLNDLKSNKDYPQMAASKFLHFFNPTLFPIYDGKVIENQVLRVFLDDYFAWVEKEGWLRERDFQETFNLKYTLWAGSLIQHAHPNLMVCFQDWFKREVQGAEDPHNILDRMDTYYATAFEFVAIGAMCMEHKDC